MERAIDLQALGMSFDISGDRAASVDLLQKAVALVDSIAQHNPGYRNIQERKAKLLVQLGSELVYTADLVKARQEAEDGVMAYQGIVDKGAQPDTVRDLAQSRVHLARICLMGNDLPSAMQNLRLARTSLEPLAKADSGNILFRTDLLSLDFDEGRLLVLQGRFKEAKAQLLRVIADFAKLGSEEDIGPGNGVLFTWVGEAEFGMKDYPHALQSFQKAIAALEGEVQYDDGRTGLIADYVRLGNTQLKLGRLSDAEAAYNKAESKTNLEVAEKMRNIPAIYSAVEVAHGWGELWMMKSVSASNSEERVRAREKACGAYKASLEVRALVSTTLRFSPSEFPVTDQTTVTRNWKGCEAIVGQTVQ